MDNLIVVVIIALIIGGAGMYIYKAKKKGQKCIGCPYAKECGKGGCGCNTKFINKDL